MTVEYATRAELDHVREALTRDLRDTERLLRDRDDQQERRLRAEFLDAVAASETRTHERFDGLDRHLAEQDKYIMRRRFTWTKWRRDVLLFAFATMLASLPLHYLFGIG